jgi:hypothetical protein
VLAFGAAVLAFTGALIGAWIAASSANRRQKADLEAAAERHAATLAAESRRLEQQLRHDRAIVEMQQLQELFDEVAARYEAALATTVFLQVTARSDPPLPASDFKNLRKQSREALLPLMEMVRRLQLRFQVNDDLVASVRVASDEFLKIYRTFPDATELPASDEQTAAANKHLDEARTRFDAFCEASRRYLGSKPDGYASTK